MSKYCSNCGEEIKEGNKFCTQCGVKYQEDIRKKENDNNVKFSLITLVISSVALFFITSHGLEYISEILTLNKNLSSYIIGYGSAIPSGVFVFFYLKRFL